MREKEKFRNAITKGLWVPRDDLRVRFFGSSETRDESDRNPENSFEIEG